MSAYLKLLILSLSKCLPECTWGKFTFFQEICNLNVYIAVWEKLLFSGFVYLLRIQKYKWAIKFGNLMIPSKLVYSGCKKVVEALNDDKWLLKTSEKQM